MCQKNECYLIETGYTFLAPNGEKGFKRNMFLPFPLLPNFIRERKSVGVFHTAYRYNSQDIDNSYLYGDLYFDFDNETSFESVRKDALYAVSFLEVKFKIKREHLKIFYSGNKGIHIIVPAQILNVEPHLNLNLIFKTIAIDLHKSLQYKTLDLQVYDNKRLFRIPNTKHEKSGLYKIPLTVEELFSLSEKEIKDLAKTTRELPYEPITTSNLIAEQRYLVYIGQYFKDVEEMELRLKQRFAKKLNFIPPCIQSLLDNGAERGMRNHTIAILAGFYKLYGKSLSETIELIEDWNSNNSSPTGSTELNRTVKSIYSSEKHFGCSTLKQMDLCNESCKLCKKEKK